MKLHALIHGPNDGLGKIADWAAARGHSVTLTLLFTGEQLPSFATFDLLVIMGGGMNIDQHRDHPWLVPEKRFIGEAIERGKKVLGICLGGQLIADVLGAKVYQNPVKEIGWFPIRTVVPHGACAVFPPQMTVFHWHGDTFEIPRGAVRVAGSEACANQAFAFGERVVGLQFHIEVTPESVADFIAGGESELVPARFVQAPTEVLQPPVGFEPSVLGDLLDALERVE